MTFDDGVGEIVKGADASINDLSRLVMKSTNPAPIIAEIPDTYVKLPAGIIVNNEVVQEAEVRELTGQDEEFLAKAKTSNNAAKYVSTLLQRGVVAIGDEKATPALLDSLIQGDLDTLIMGVRRATFGNDFEVFNVPCPSCGELNDLELDLKDIPIKELDDPLIREFYVDMRRGRRAKVEFPTGAVQNELFKKPVDVAVMNSITLSHCVLAFVEADGSERPSNGLLDVNKLGLADRKAILDFLYDNQPGPRYDQVVAKCHACEGEVPVPLNVGILFREL